MHLSPVSGAPDLAVCPEYIVLPLVISGCETVDLQARNCR